MNKKNVGIIGHFGKNKNFTDGQTVKTKEIYNELIKKSKFNISVVDTYNCKKNIHKFISHIKKLLKENEYIIIIVASGGLKFLIPLLVFWNKFYDRKICYCAVGSWVDVRVKHRPLLKKVLRKVDLILVETLELKKSLHSLGFQNVEIMHNFKNLKNVNRNIYQLNHFCTFSRVNKDKGITDLILTFDKLIDDGNDIYLDIYGPVEDKYKKEFNNLIKNSHSNIRYCGIRNFDEGAKCISEYFMLIFPTKYIKEGLPGTLIDSYCAGVPVIASNWVSASEFVPKNVGYIYNFNDLNDLKKKILFCINHPEETNLKKQSCIEFSKKFTPEIAIKPLLAFLEGKYETKD